MTAESVTPRTPDAEPDYRFSLANERTALAGFRTALALLAASGGASRLIPEFVSRARGRR